MHKNYIPGDFRCGEYGTQKTRAGKLELEGGKLKLESEKLELRAVFFFIENGPYRGKIWRGIDCAHRRSIETLKKLEFYVFLLLFYVKNGVLCLENSICIVFYPI